MHDKTRKGFTMFVRSTCLGILLAVSTLVAACAKAPDRSAFADSGSKGDVASDVAFASDLPPASDAFLASDLQGEAGLTGEVAAEVAIPSCISNADDLIADFTTDNGLAPVDGREGGFYLYGDNSLKGQFFPPVVKGQPYPVDKTTGNPHCSGPGSFHVTASGWGVWGAALGTDLAPKVSLEAGVNAFGEPFKGTYDASKYRGVSFWAKASAPLKGVQVSFPDVFTDAAATFASLFPGAGVDGGSTPADLPDAADPTFADPTITSCVYSTDVRYNCSPYLVKFGAKLGDDSLYFHAYRDYQIDTTWKRFDVYFADTHQDQYNRGFHAAPSLDQSNLDLKHLTAMAIQVNADWSTGSAKPNDFEIWIDDVYFIR